MSDESSIIPETLLALAKDSRYVQRVKELLIRCCDALLQEPHGGDENITNSGDNGPALSALLSASLPSLSLTLYALFMVRNSTKNQTLGMEFTGLEQSQLLHDSETMITPGQRSNTNTTLALWKTLALMGLFPFAVTVLNHNQRQQHRILRGQERLLFHQEQRRAMAMRTSGTTTPSNGHSNKSSNTSGNTSEKQQHHHIKVLFNKFIQHLSNMSRFQHSPPGPHNLPTANTPQTQTQTQLSMVSWMMKLYLTHYCWTGRTPFGITRSQQTSNTTISNRPKNKTFHWIAIMIGLQAVGNGLLWVVSNSNWSTRVKPITSEPTTPSTTPSSTCCFICGLPRTFPAASVSCGHVFCWKCLHQWTSRQGKCPLCRATCRPQDIMALHNYELPS